MFPLLLRSHRIVFSRFGHGVRPSIQVLKIWARCRIRTPFCYPSPTLVDFVIKSLCWWNWVLGFMGFLKRSFRALPNLPALHFFVPLGIGIAKPKMRLQKQSKNPRSLEDHETPGTFLHPEGPGRPSQSVRGFFAKSNCSKRSICVCNCSAMWLVS